MYSRSCAPAHSGIGNSNLLVLRWLPISQALFVVSGAANPAAAGNTDPFFPPRVSLAQERLIVQGNCWSNHNSYPNRVVLMKNVGQAFPLVCCLHSHIFLYAVAYLVAFAYFDRTVPCIFPDAILASVFSGGLATIFYAHFFFTIMYQILFSLVTLGCLWSH